MHLALVLHEVPEAEEMLVAAVATVSLVLPDMPLQRFRASRNDAANSARQRYPERGISAHVNIGPLPRMLLPVVLKLGSLAKTLPADLTPESLMGKSMPGELLAADKGLATTRETAGKGPIYTVAQQVPVQMCLPLVSLPAAWESTPECLQGQMEPPVLVEPRA